MSTPFWPNDPTILFRKEYLLDVYPTEKMTYEEKVNAITRLVIYITLLGYIGTMNIRLLFTGIITILGIYFYVKMNVSKQKVTRKMLKEGFGFVVPEDPNSEDFSEESKEVKSHIKSEFHEGTSKNPFSNVLLTDIMDDPTRKPAPPSFNPLVEQKITANVKNGVQMLNPSMKNSSKQLFGDLSDQFDLDQSNRIFYSTANTRVANDQTAFANYLYGNMPSAKDSGIESGIQRVKDAYRHTLY
jgi:hypothetical protein